MLEVLARRLVTVVFALLCSGIFGGTISGQVSVFTVNTTSDAIVPNACVTASAGCSLRGAITASNPNGNAIIQFSIPTSDPFCAAGVCTININSQLPSINGTNTWLRGPGADRVIIRTATGVTSNVLSVAHVSGFVTISGLTIRDGRGGAGQTGGVHKAGAGILELVEVALRDNVGPGAGGIRVTAGGLIVIRSFIRNNSATAAPGGGIRIDPGATCNITNSSIMGNGADMSAGGGIYTLGTTNITNSTIFGNVSAGDGGGIRNGGAIVSVKSTIIGGNFAAVSGNEASGTFTSAGFNLISRVEGSTGFTAPTDLIGTLASPLNPRIDGGDRSQGGPTLTLGLLRNSPAIDKGSSNGLTGALTTDQRGGAFGRIRDNPLLANAVGGDGTDIGAYERSAASVSDFDGDVRSDIGIFRPADASWWINRSSNGSTVATPFGNTTDRIVPADFTGDGKIDIAVWRPGNGQWFILRSEDSSFFGFGFGTGGDIPAPADYDNDGRSDPAVFRPSSGTWFVQRSTGSLSIVGFGVSGDVPVPADYDGDGRDDIAIYRPSNGQWWLERSQLGVIAFAFGATADKPVPEDFTGDGKIDAAFWRPSTGEWFVLRSENSSYFSYPFGTSGDLPAPGDFDGDGRTDPTVFRPSNANWYIDRTSSGFFSQQFGSAGDRPITNAYIP